MPTTPTPLLPTYYDGDLLTGTTLNGVSLNTANLYSYVLGGFRVLKPLLQLSGATTTLSSGADTLIGWPAEAVDSDGSYTLNATSVVVATAGWYRMNLRLAFSTAANGSRACRIMVNGTNPAANAVAADCREPVTTYMGATPKCQCTTYLAAGSTVYTGGTSSGATSVLTTAWGGSSFSMEWMST